MKNHKHYQRAYSAYANVSFSPERSAEGECIYYNETVAKLISAGKEDAVARFEALFLKALDARGRCASSMIVGPARFPVERNLKRMEWARNANQAMFDFVEKVLAPPREPRTELDYGITDKEYNVGDVRVVHNTELNRLQLLFPGKPAAEIIQKLKRTGYKWSPKNKAWQRQLTPNALYSVKHVLG